MQSSAAISGTATSVEKSVLWMLRRFRLFLLSLLALILVGGIWFGLTGLNVHARLAFIIFGLTVIGWCFTKIDQTYLALTAAIVFPLTGTLGPDDFFKTLGDPMIWLMLAAFVIAAGVRSSGLLNRLITALVARTRTVSQLFYVLTAAITATAFVIPSTSGRAALMIPIFTGLSSAIISPTITKALALLFPSVILLSAIASFIGAGAHLVTAAVLLHMAGGQIGFGRWLILGLPFALVSCFASTWVILHLFLSPSERVAPLLPGHLVRPGEKGQGSRQPLNRKEWRALGIALVLIVSWATESIHGVNSSIIALLGALAVTAPRIGLISFNEGIKAVDWNILLFMAAAVALGDTLVKSGGAEWIAHGFFGPFQNHFATSPVVVISAVALLSLLSHLLIPSRTARSSILIPPVILLALSLGYNPGALAFLSTTAAGFCMSLPISAKPVVLFAQMEGPTYDARDLVYLSGFLLPLHFILLLLFAFFVWPLMGLPLSGEAVIGSVPGTGWY